MNRRWLINRTNPEYLSYLSRAASISPILAQILINRGIRTASDIASFLNPGVTSLSDPYELPDMRAAVERIKAALKNGERVLVHGDYDADGITSTAIMVGTLRGIGIDADYFIPNRMIHGYGFNPPSVDIAKRLGAKLIITVDCGISSMDAVEYALKAGIDVIVTDHHEPARGKGQGAREELLLPEALAVVNPKLMDSRRVSQFSGAGVAFKVAQALAADRDVPFSADDASSLLDLAAIGTVADVVPLIDENRAILKEGLRYIQGRYRPGIRSLMQVSGLGEKEMRAWLLSFVLVPRMNAAGRIGDARDVVTLLLSGSEEETLSIAERLDRTNSERQRIEEEVYQEARSELDRKGYEAAIVLHKEGWHLGVIGIVASRIAEEFHRPAFVFTVDGDIAKGSGRSIPGFDIHQALSRCGDLLISFGGHKQAAGLRLQAERLPLFEKEINRIAGDSFEREEIIPSVEIDAEVALQEVNAALIREFSLLEPFGYGNPEPLLGARRLEIVNPRIVGNNHLKMRLKQRSAALDAIGFSMGKHFESLSTTHIDAVFTPTFNEWNGGRHLQLNLKALRPSV